MKPCSCFKRKSLGARRKNPQEAYGAVASQVVAWLRGVGRGRDVRRVRLAGHSLGGALATLAAVHLAEEFNVEAGRPRKRLIVPGIGGQASPLFWAVWRKGGPLPGLLGEKTRVVWKKTHGWVIFDLVVQSRNPSIFQEAPLF